VRTCEQVPSAVEAVGGTAASLRLAALFGWRGDADQSVTRIQMFEIESW
jgi:hypothetical protein